MGKKLERKFSKKERDKIVGYQLWFHMEYEQAVEDVLGQREEPYIEWKGRDPYIKATLFDDSYLFWKETTLCLTNFSVTEYLIIK